MKEKCKTKEMTIRSSAAEYLTFIASTGSDSSSIEMRYEDEDIWLTQKLLATLYDVEVNTINYHIKKIYSDFEQQRESTIRKFRIVQNEGNRTVERDIEHYNLQIIIAVGFKVNNERAVQFRKWANNIVGEYTIKGFAMDDERLKNDGSIITKKYFDEQLQRIREIRLSERKFYQKITDIFATSLDYDVTSRTTQEFFAKVQNKLHWAIHGQTASEVVYNRADSEKKNMGLTTWTDAPKGKIQKFDVVAAKNYLTEEELSAMSYLVNAYLDLAEMQANRNIPMTMQDWATQFNGILTLSRYEILTNAGSISAEIAKKHAETQFEKYRIVQDKLFENDFDRLLIKVKSLTGD